MDLFKPDSPWSNAAKNVTALKISTQFALRASDEQLTTLIKDLQRRHIALAIEIGVLVGSPRCGMGGRGLWYAGRRRNRRDANPEAPQPKIFSLSNFRKLRDHPN
jgi:hypothetical protein